MVKIFRTLRKKLVKDGSSKRYLAYALGEVFLVMIGILLAVQVNNWNERRKQLKLETQYLQQLKTDLSSDRTYYNDRIKMYSRAYDSLHKFISSIYEIQENREDVKNLLRQLNLSTDPLLTNNPTYLELMSTGNLGIVEPKELKIAITNYYRLNEQYAMQIAEYNATSNQLVVEVLKSVPTLIKYSLQLHQQELNYEDSEWWYLNEPSSIEFQSIETLASIVQNRNNEFLGYLKNLHKSSIELIDKISEKLK